MSDIKFVFDSATKKCDYTKTENGTIPLSMCREFDKEAKPSTTSKILSGLDSGTRGLGTIKIWVNIATAILIIIIGLSIFFWGRSVHGVKNVKVCNGPIKEKPSESMQTYISDKKTGTKSSRIVYTYNDPIEIEDENKKCHVIEKSTLVNIHENLTGLSIISIKDEDGIYKYQKESAHTALMWTGGIITVVGLAGVLINVLLRNNPWYQRFLGITTGSNLLRGKGF